MLNNVWVEDLRPKKLDEIIGNDLLIKVLKRYITEGDIPHLLFSGSPGTAKTTSALCIAEELYGSSVSHFVEMNSSNERGIDVVRDKIKDIATKASNKIIFLDECDAMCLDKDTEVMVEDTEVLAHNKHYGLMKKIKIKDVPQDRYIPIPSLNVETKEIENDHGKCIDSGEQDLFKIILENGKGIIASKNHPFFYLNNDRITEIKTRELTYDSKILDFEELTEEIKIKSIKYVGKRKTYNITMQKNKNFFLANGILTHNTSDAQNALRRIIERYSGTARFILSCNYRHKIIEPIQSRMTCLHFSPLTSSEMNILIDRVCAKKSIIVPPEIREILFKHAKGDARCIINPLQSASMLSSTITKEAIQLFTQTPDINSTRLIITTAISGDFISAREMLLNIFINKGFDYESVCEAMLEIVKEIQFTEDKNRNNRIIATINAIIANHSHYMSSSNPIIEFSGILAKISMIQSINSVEQVI